MQLQSISPASLKEKLDSDEPIHLIDVREPWEHEQFNIGGELVPMDQILQKQNDIPKDKTIVLYCQKGIRSSIAIQRLQQKYPYTNLFNLAGGMNAWRLLIKKDEPDDSK